MSKKAAVAVAFIVVVATAFVGLVLADHFGNVVQLETEIIRHEAYLEGYSKGLDDGAGHGYTIRDPTYQEAILFKALDQTDENGYGDETYTCFNFVADFEANAFDAGYRCGLVYVEFADWAHAMVCFDTIDKGLIYIEPQDDKIVPLKVGSSYWDDIVIYIAIVW